MLKRKNRTPQTTPCSLLLIVLSFHGLYISNNIQQLQQISLFNFAYVLSERMHELKKLQNKLSRVRLYSTANSLIKPFFLFQFSLMFKQNRKTEACRIYYNISYTSCHVYLAVLLRFAYCIYRLYMMQAYRLQTIHYTPFFLFCFAFKMGTIERRRRG